MNWLLLVCFVAAAAAVGIGLTLVGREGLRLYRKTQEIQRQVAPPVEYLRVGQERTMALVESISRRQGNLARQLQEAAASIGVLAVIAGELREAQDQLTGMAID